jgi:hypothetical protein
MHLATSNFDVNTGQDGVYKMSICGQNELSAIFIGKHDTVYPMGAGKVEESRTTLHTQILSPPQSITPL